MKKPAFDLFGTDDKPVRFPHRSKKSALTLLRFTAPSHTHPEGLVVAAGHPPFRPSVIGMTIRERA